jgi:hypothetical protein
MEKLFKTNEELADAIDNYFEEHCGITYNDEGKVDFCKPPTVSGLALYLGFADRQSLYDYKKQEAHSCTIKKAITRMEQFAEEQLFAGKTPTGAIFWLKNHRWSDKQEIELSGTPKIQFDIVSPNEDTPETS